MKLTKEEEKIILEHRKKERDNLPKKIGFSKENLYIPETDWTISYYLSESEKNDLIKKFTDAINSNMIPSGTVFICYIDDNRESWYSHNDDFGFENMSEAWAKLYLTGIRKITKKDFDDYEIL